MRSDWQVDELQNVAEVIDSRHKTPDYATVGHPMVRVVDVKGGILDLAATKQVSEEVYADFSKGRNPQVGDLVISRVGSYGNICFVSSNEKFCLGQNTALIVPKNIDARFFYYQMISPLVKNQIETVVVGAVQKTISLKSIKQLEIRLPSEPTQKRIAQILSGLDDKIANNGALAADLEAIARAIFKSWFVDFDPVKAKMEGRAPAGMNADTAALFPDELVESELGLIPKGWEAMSFEKAFDFTMGQSPPGSELNERGDGLPFFQGSADFNTVFPSFRVYCPTPRREANENDVLFSVRAPVGDCNIAKGKCGIGRGLCAIRSKFAGTGVTYPWMKSITADLQRASGEGVVFSSLSKAQLASCPVVVAPRDVYKAADQILSPILDLMANLDEESISLSSTRDSLLPRLISGKLRLPA